MVSQLVRAFVIGVIVSVAHGCWPLPRVDQENFCNADYAYVRRYNKKLYILKYRSMDYVKPSDIERMRTKYDCSCKIEWYYSNLSSRASLELPPPTRDECNVSGIYCRNSAFCRRNETGFCTWGNLGECD